MTREQLEQSIQTNMPTNGVGLIAASNTRQVAEDIADYVDTEIDTRLFVTDDATNIGNVEGNGAYSNVDSGRRNWIETSSNGAAISLSGLQIGLDASGRIYSRKEENAEWSIVNQLQNVTETDVNKITYPAFIGYTVIENGPISASEGHHFDVFTFTSADVDGNGWRSILQIAIDRDSDNRYLRTTYAQLGDQAPWFSTNWIKINFDENWVIGLLNEHISEITTQIPNTVEQTTTNVVIKHSDSEGTTNLFSIESATASRAGVMTPTQVTALSNAAPKTSVPTDISRTQNDATFVNSSSQALFYLRQATSRLAGLMTSTDKNKLDNIPDIYVDETLTVDDLISPTLSQATITKLNTLRASTQKLKFIKSGDDLVQFMVQISGDRFNGYVIDYLRGNMIQVSAEPWTVEIIDITNDYIYIDDSLTVDDLLETPLSYETMGKLNTLRASAKPFNLISYNSLSHTLIQLIVDTWGSNFDGYVFDALNMEVLHITAGPTTPAIDWTVTVNKIGGSVSGRIGNLVEIGQDNVGADSGISADEVVLSETVRHIVTLTQAEFDALTSYDSNTEYNVI